MFEVDLGEVKDSRVDIMCQNGTIDLGRHSNAKYVSPELNDPEGFRWGRIISFDIQAARGEIPGIDKYYLAIGSEGQLWVGVAANNAKQITWHEK